MQDRVVFPVIATLAILLTSCAGAGTPVPWTATMPPTGAPTATPTHWLPPTATPTAEATEMPRPSPTPVPPSPTPDMVATIVAARESEVIQTHASPDGSWRVDVVAYPCDAEAPSAEQEKVLEQLMLVHQQTGTETVIQSQVLTCGGLGAAGLGGLFWSPDSQIFYFTDAREGVPDGGGGLCWDRPLWTLHVDEGKAEHHADIWARSRSGDQLAVVREEEEIVVEALGAKRISRAPLPPEYEVCQIAWSPEEDAFAYLRTRDPFQPGPWDLICVDGQTGACNVALELQDTAGVSMTWDSPTEIAVWGLQDGERTTRTVDRPCGALEITPSPPSTDIVLLAREDGSLVLHPLSGGPERELLGPGLYDVSGDAFLTPIVSPVRLSPDGVWLLVPTPKDGTWLVSLDGETRRRVSLRRLTATWAPESRRIVFPGEPGPDPEGQESEITVQNVVDGGEPRVLARLPGKAWFPTWSPGCGDPSSNQIAAFSTEAGTAMVWLLDAGSGERRSLGQFIAQATEGAPDMIRWSPDCEEVWISARFGPRAFPLDGGGPRALVSRQRKASPDGTLLAGIERTSDLDATRLIVWRVDSGATVRYDEATFEQAEGVDWTSDGRRVLVQAYTGDGYKLWAVDPAVGEPELVAEQVTFLGTLHNLRQKSTEVAAEHLGIRRLSPPGAPGTWTVHELPCLRLGVRVPEGWRFEIDDVGGPPIATLANFEVVGAQGGASLGDDHIEITFRLLHGRPNEDFSTWLSRTMEMEQHHVTAEIIRVDGRQGARLRPIVSPISEEIRVPLGDRELCIERRPISTTEDAVFEQILNTVTIQE